MRGNPVVAVDFDHTIVEMLESGSYAIKAGAVEALRSLKSKGCTIVIHTCRIGIAKGNGDLSDVIETIQSVLDQFDVPYDSIHLGTKVVADAYIDDRAVTFRGDWTEAQKEAESLIFER